MNGPRPIRTAHRLPNARSSLVRAALPAPSTPRTPRAPGCALRTPPAVALSAVRSLHACVAPSPLHTPQSRGHEGWPFRDLRRPLVDRGARSAERGALSEVCGGPGGVLPHPVAPSATPARSCPRGSSVAQYEHAVACVASHTCASSGTFQCHTMQAGCDAALNRAQAQR